MSVEQQTKLNPYNEGSWALVIGGVASAAYIVFVILVAYADWPATWTLDVFGNFLSGACAPLAFLWLVIATMLQRKELQQNREAMNAQIDETKHLVEASEKSAKAATDAAENQNRDESVKRLNELIDLLSADIALKAPDLNFRSGPNPDRFFGTLNSAMSSNEIIYAVAKTLIAKVGNSIAPGMQMYADRDAAVRNLQEIDHTVKVILSTPTDNAAASTRIRMLRLPEFSAALDKTIAEAKVAAIFQPR